MSKCVQIVRSQNSHCGSNGPANMEWERQERELQGWHWCELMISEIGILCVYAWLFACVYRYMYVSVNVYMYFQSSFHWMGQEIQRHSSDNKHLTPRSWSTIPFLLKGTRSLQRNDWFWRWSMIDKRGACNTLLCQKVGKCSKKINDKASYSQRHKSLTEFGAEYPNKWIE